MVFKQLLNELKRSEKTSPFSIFCDFPQGGVVKNYPFQKIFLNFFVLDFTGYDEYLVFLENFFP